MNVIRRLFINVGIICLSVVFVVSVLEFGVFRYVLAVSDLPRLAENEGGVLSYIPNQKGIYRLQDEIAAPYRINDNGWNSGREKYTQNKNIDVIRICIVGDSYIEALQVHHKSSVAEYLENSLRNTGKPVEVYRFGISGAPLSHYIYMIENEILKYRPDIIIVNIVHNDFLESLNPAIGTYSASFSKLIYDAGGREMLSSPQPYRRKLSWLLKTTATFRYLWVRKQFHSSSLKRMWSYLSQQGVGTDNPVYSANIEIKSVKDTKVVLTIDALFNMLTQIRRDNEVELLLVIDGDRSSIAEGIDEGKDITSLVGDINRKVAVAADKYSLPLLDLTEWFATDYREHRILFRFKNDGHWNERAHRVVANSIAIKLRELELLY